MKSHKLGYFKIFDFDFSSHLIKGFSSSRDYGVTSHHLLDVDTPCFIRRGCDQTTYRVTSLDVIHSFALPRIGMKIDAVPGKGNSVTVDRHPGHFFGQCSEICGTGHTVIPISIDVRYLKDSFFIKGVEVCREKPCCPEHCIPAMKAQGASDAQIAKHHMYRGEYVVKSTYLGEFVSACKKEGFFVLVDGRPISYGQDSVPFITRGDASITLERYCLNPVNQMTVRVF